jgi:hypothetical protein
LNQQPFEFTPLNALAAEVLMQIQDVEELTRPRKIKLGPDSRPHDKYCHFHQDHKHDIKVCFALRKKLESLLKKGKLMKFVADQQK